MIPRKPHHKGFKSKGKRLNPVGKSNRSTTRRTWQKEMIQTFAHIDSCEYPECYSTFGLAHAHSLKKTKITTHEQYMDIAKLCQHHHDWVEYGDEDNPGTHERMFDMIHEIQRLSRFR